MGQGYFDEVFIALKALGYYRVKDGKHQKWCHDGGLPTLIVPHNVVSRHTANGILKDAGLPKKF